MPITTDYSRLTAEERAAIADIIPRPPEGEAAQTVEEYLSSVGAGQAAIDSYVAQYDAKYLDAMRALAEGLKASGIPFAQIEAFGRALITATPEKRAQAMAALA